jgi:hypothetical protein
MPSGESQLHRFLRSDLDLIVAKAFLNFAFENGVRFSPDLARRAFMAISPFRGLYADSEPKREAELERRDRKRDEPIAELEQTADEAALESGPLTDERPADPPREEHATNVDQGTTRYTSPQKRALFDLLLEVKTANHKLKRAPDILEASDQVLSEIVSKPEREARVKAVFACVPPGWKSGDHKTLVSLWRRGCKKQRGAISTYIHDVKIP